MAGWEELPRDALELIARRLAAEDFLAFRGVCTSWRSAAAKETYDAKSKAPWVKVDRYRPKAEFYSPSRGTDHEVESPGSHVQTLFAFGWILAAKGGCEYCIFNPLTRVSIDLPSLERLSYGSQLTVELDWMEGCRYSPWEIERMALSSSPSLSRSYTVLISASVHHSLGRRVLAFHRSGEDGWTVVSPPTHLPEFVVLQLIHYDGLFVALVAQDQIMTLDLEERRMQLRLVLGQKFLDCPYLVECSGSLLVAWKIRGKGVGSVKGIRVFKVDLEKGTQEEVKSLGNASLFLNNISSFSAEFNAESCLPGIKPNHVYFTGFFHMKKTWRYNMRRVWSYNMDDGRVETYFDGTGRDVHACECFQPDF